jgi:hypothetical protein
MSCVFEGGSDSEFELISRLSTKLFRISETSGRIDVMAWVGQEVTKDMLDSSAAFILDCQSMIFVWAGMYSSMSERSWAMLKAEVSTHCCSLELTGVRSYRVMHFHLHLQLFGLLMVQRCCCLLISLMIGKILLGM